MSSEPRYVSIKLSKVIPEKELPGDLYLFLNGHFVRYKGKGDVLPKQKYELFVAQKVQYLFVQQSDAANYEKWASDSGQKIIKEQIDEVGEENRDVVEKNQEVKEAFFNFVTTEVTERSVKEILEKTREFIGLIKKKAGADRFMAKIMSYDQTIGDHSTNVANLSVFLAMNTGYSQQLILENIYNGGLLHDFGKTRVNAKFLEDPNSKEALAAMKKHPELGKTALLLDSGFPDEVLRIIGEHHERHDGKGYPKAIKGPKIYELTKIVSIANEFDNVAMAATGDARQRQQRAYKELEADQGKIFDPKILGKCLRALEPLIMK